ncbi:terminase large subunit [Dongia sp.]|uniref:terminase large subunit n=1 Tax=Dongia sp. TaxID=1977262 RepID=UPI0035B30EA2
MTVMLSIPTMPRGGEKFGAYWDERAAAAACAFFPTFLCHTEAEWAGKPFVLADWQRDLIRQIFGWKRADGTRLIRIVWLEVPRKNGKTELAAGVSLLALLGDAEYGGQAYSMAVDKDQAKIVFDKAAVMVGFSKRLAEHLDVFAPSIYCQQLNASFKPLASGARSKHGFSPSFAVGDEVHEWNDGGTLADVVHKGTGARRQPLEFYITTAGIKGEGYASEMHDFAMMVLSGEIEDPTFLPVIFAAPDDESWWSEESIKLANPNYGISIKAEYLREEAKKARRTPRAENDFKRFHLNIWTEQLTRWLPMDKWKGCTAQPANALYWRALFDAWKGRLCYGGLDLAITDDITSLCWAFPPDRDWERWGFLWRFWRPIDTLENEPLPRKRRYEAFEAQQALTLTPGNVTDYGLVRQAILADCKSYDVQQIGIDKFNASQLATDLLNQDGLPIEWFRQGTLSMNGPSRTFERLVASEALEHGNHPVAKWMAQNAVVESDAVGNIKPVKGKAADKIDGIVAAIMGIGLGFQAEPDGSAALEAWLNKPVMVI